MSEMEASFLVSSLALFRNQKDFGKAKPRANVNLMRAYTSEDFYRSVTGDEDILHLIGHANGERIEVGTGKAKVLASNLAAFCSNKDRSLPEIFVSTGCGMHSARWRECLAECGVKVMIAAEGDVTPANLVAFDMAFYSALLSQTYKGKSLTERVNESFEIADTHYRAIHAKGTPFAKFQLSKL